VVDVATTLEITKEYPYARAKGWRWNEKEEAFIRGDDWIAPHKKGWEHYDGYTGQRKIERTLNLILKATI